MLDAKCRVGLKVYFLHGFLHTFGTNMDTVQAGEGYLTGGVKHLVITELISAVALLMIELMNCDCQYVQSC